MYIYIYIRSKKILIYEGTVGNDAICFAVITIDRYARFEGSILLRNP